MDYAEQISSIGTLSTNHSVDFTCPWITMSELLRRAGLEVLGTTDGPEWTPSGAA
jgi:hypothetical protein